MKLMRCGAQTLIKVALRRRSQEDLVLRPCGTTLDTAGLQGVLHAYEVAQALLPHASLMHQWT